MYLSISLTRRMLSASIAVTLIAALAGSAVSRRSGAQQTSATKSDQTFSVQRVFKAGDVDRYRMKITQTINGPLTNGKDYPVKMNIVMKETTKSVAENGQVTVTEEYTKADGSFNGQDTDMMPMMPTVTLKKDKAGLINVSTEGGQEPVTQQISGMAKMLLQSRAALLPGKPIMLGDTWSSDISIPGPDGDTTTRLTVKLDGVEVLDGIKTLRLKTTTDTTGGAQADTKLRGEGLAYIDAASGKPVKMTSKAAGTEKGAKVSKEMIFEKAGPEDLKPSKKEAAPK